MLTSKIVQIEFADSRIKAEDAILDIRKAAQFVSLNLYSRYDVQLQAPVVFNDGRVAVEVKIPQERADDFAIGNHLRGVSMYLLKKCGDQYGKYLVGNRLLTYTEISAANTEDISFSVTDRLEAIASFAHLLERSDSDSLDRISRILSILKETDRK